MRGGILIVAMALGPALAGPAAAQQIEAGNVQLRFTGRAQVQYTTTSVEDEDAGGPIAALTFETRRIRLAARLTVDDWITAMIEPEFAGGDAELRNAWVDLGFDETVALRIGHFKKPFSRLRLTSSTTFPTVERGVRIRGLEDALALADASGGNPVLTSFAGDPLLGEEQALLDALGYTGYDLGAVLHGQLGRLDYEAGAFNGRGADAPDLNDAKSVAARAAWSFETDAPLAVGAGVSYRELGDPTADGTAVEVDAEWGEFRREGLHVIAELATGSTIAADARFLGAHAILSWFRPLDAGRIEGYEVVGRASWGDPNDDVDDDAGVLLTPGVNLYFFGRNMLLLNWDVYVPQADHLDTQHSVKVQARFHF